MKISQGYVHSIYNGGMVDGPGIRSVVFLSGCPLRCKYCHNPDSWEKTSGKLMTVDEVVEEVLKYRTFYKVSGGGITISGGEPFLQAQFLTEILKACKLHGINTAIDTSGYASLGSAKKAFKYTDLLLLDIKGYYPENYKSITGVAIDKTLAMLELAKELNLPTWIRYVLVPGLTDNKDELKDLADFLRSFDNIENIDVLPFHKEGEYKWHSRSLPYELADTPPPTRELLAEVKKIFHLFDTLQ
ncbi:MAG: pyruvate formate-lyase-activating protein [Firmicutes bacterium]|nr:pyruvate formate-lyase-activating protein [Bacillota bacterium]